ncbi:hypothetical protein DXG01_002568 [Tephrocybe rancida]|nr:hypothetical protein DXG01_002568 [Tephrocybe rancida]
MLFSLKLGNVDYDAASEEIVDPPWFDIRSSSTLTIVRVVSPSPQQETAPAPSSSPRRIHRHLPFQSSTATPPTTAPERLSFAFSSFGSGSASGGPAAIPNPSTSPRLRPSSPHRSSSPHHLSTNLPSIPRLSPDQLLDLARSTTTKRVGYSESSPAHSPQLRASSPLGHAPQQTTAPATFTPLPDDIHLPFIDRPSEVATLIASPPSAKLFSLLAKTLATITVPSTDPSKWTYDQLHEHLTQTTRLQSSDVVWVFQARKCIISHSELIWERVKGALGVPPELDVDYDPSQPYLLSSELFEPSSAHSTTSSIDTDELSDDHGRAARGHWEDWDAIMDSPVYDRRLQSHPTSPVVPFHLDVGKDMSDAAVSPALFSANNGPVSPSSFLSIEPLLAPSSTSPIAHIASISPSSYPGPTNDISGLALDDIQEGAEDDDDTTSTAATEDTATGAERDADAEADPTLIAPSQIQGLRISTAPISAAELIDPPASAPTSASAVQSMSSSVSSVAGSYKPPSPISPLPPYNYPAGTAGSSAPRSRPPSFGASGRPQVASYGLAGAPSVFRRSGSFGSLGSLREHLHLRERSAEEGDGYASSASASESGHGYERDRGPLFPSSFARLSKEPTLGLG